MELVYHVMDSRLLIDPVHVHQISIGHAKRQPARVTNQWKSGSRDTGECATYCVCATICAKL